MSTELRISGNTITPTFAIREGEGDEKVTFSEAQTKRVNEIVQERLSRAKSEAHEEAQRVAAENTRLAEELRQAREEATKAKTPAAKKEATDEAERLKAVIEEMRTASESNKTEAERLRQAVTEATRRAQEKEEEAHNVRKQVAIRDAAQRANFFDLNVVTTITEKNIKWDAAKSKFLVFNDQGTERMNAAFEPMSLDEYYSEYAAKNPWMVRGDVKPGAGSSEAQRQLSNNGKFEVSQIFGSKSSSVLAVALKKQNPAEYARLKGIAKESGLIA
jgi:DNA repair exonuclease SbcCD ATPase subunit